LTPLCNKSFVGWGFAPRPHWGSLQRSLRPLSCIKDLLLKGGVRRGRKKRRRGEKGRKRRGRKGEGRRGREGVRPLPYE